MQDDELLLFGDTLNRVKLSEDGIVPVQLIE